MYRKSLIAIGTVILISGTLYAHTSWPVEFGQYKEVPSKSVEVRILIAEWAKIWPASVDPVILLTNSEDPEIFKGQMEFRVLNNFPNMRVEAELTSDYFGIWSISLEETDVPVWVAGGSYGASTFENIDETHFSSTNGSGALFLSVKVEGWDPTSSTWITETQAVQVAQVTLTMYVNSAPVTVGTYEVKSSQHPKPDNE